MGQCTGYQYKNSYQNYLNSYPNGIYATQARNAIRDFETRIITQSLSNLRDVSGNTYKYHGETQNNLPHRKGKATFTNGNVYEGDFRNGRIHGQGVLNFDPGNRYTGEFANDQRNGQGTMAWASGDNYTGAWRDGHRTGRGT